MKNLLLPVSLLAFTALGCTSTGGGSQKEPDQQEMMAAMQRAATPGAQHKALDAFVGTWDAKVTFWMDPKAPPMESTGTMVNSWIYDGHYLEQKFEGDMGGMPFQGTGMWGFDVAAGKYVSTWFDSMSTSISVGSGPASKDGKTFLSEAINTNPITGEPSKGSEVITIVSPSEHKMEMFEMHGDQKVKTMQIVYTKRM
ncbi:MAG: DUF1579 domain-containing protein [Planctomycetes bacterium]|nr:DUF1579 domain-containing protein [Planctomycetota bacterium]